MTSATGEGRRNPRPDWLGLGVLFLVTLLAIGGYAVFARNPGLIPDSDWARWFYGVSFKVFAQGHIVVSALAMAYVLIRHVKFQWVPAFAAVVGASFLSEHLGTGYGFPFGSYEYTSLLGWKVGGRVPWVIPISWFLMALPSWIMANAVFPRTEQRLGRVVLAAYLLTAWDLVLDPAMSYLTPYWVWENPGPFFGMPWVNLAGWMGTGVVLMALLELLDARGWAGRLSLGWSTAYYAVVALMPVGLLLAVGVWVPVLVFALSLMAAMGLAAAVRRRAGTSPPGLAQWKEQMG